MPSLHTAANAIHVDKILYHIYTPQRYSIFLTNFIPIIMKKDAFAMILIMACVVLASCSPRVTALGDTGLYAFTDPKTQLAGVTDEDGKVLIPAYAEEIVPLKDVLVCYSPKHRGMVYRLDGEPLFYEEFDYVIDSGDFLQCLERYGMYVYVYGSGKPVGPLRPCHVSYLNNTLVFSSKFEVNVYNLADKETEKIFYRRPEGNVRSFAWLGKKKKLVTGLCVGESRYASRIACGETLDADDNAVVCRTPYGTAVGEDNGDFWTFLIPSTDSTAAALTEVPKESWLVYDQSRGYDFLVVPQGWGMDIKQVDGRFVKTLSWLGWWRLHRRLEEIGELGGLHVARIDRLETE